MERPAGDAVFARDVVEDSSWYLTAEEPMLLWPRLLKWLLAGIDDTDKPLFF